MKIKVLSTCILAALTGASFFAQAAEVNFSGYARYGAHYNAGDAGDPDFAGAADGTQNRGVGRLGNEGNGGEFQFTSSFEGPSGTKWDVAVMVENWWADNNSAYVLKDDGTVGQEEYGKEYGDVNLKKFYARGTNLFASQPGLVLWAGRDFHQRPQTGLNDYFWMTHDGQGGGFENLDMGGAKLNLSFVGRAGGKDWDPTGDEGSYAITSKIHGIQFSDTVGLDIYANYGFSDETEEARSSDDNAFQIAGQLKVSGHRVTLRYSDNTVNSVYDITDGQNALYLSAEGGFSFSDSFKMDYYAGYQNVDNDGDELDNYSFILRPMKAWNDIHSTWVETGYEIVERDSGVDSDAWKITLSQNVTIDAVPWGRPMIRFYGTFGSADTDGAASADTTALGVMFESWW